MEKFSQKQIKSRGTAITTSVELKEIRKAIDFEIIGYSAGVYGLNGYLIKANDRYYAIIGRSSLLFEV